MAGTEKRERGRETKGERTHRYPSMADSDHPKRPSNADDSTMGFNGACSKALPQE